MDSLALSLKISADPFRRTSREDLVGQAISELETSHGIPRSSLYVQTKFTPIDGQDLTQPLPYEPRASTEDKIDQSIATSLKQLGVKYIDCLVMHSPMRDKKVSYISPA